MPDVGDESIEQSQTEMDGQTVSEETTGEKPAEDEKITFTTEQWNEIQQQIMMKEDYTRNMQAIKMAWGNLQPYIELATKAQGETGQQKQETLSQIPPEIQKQLEELKSQVSKFKESETARQTREQAQIEAQIVAAVDKEESEFAEKYPEIFNEYKEIVTQVSSGKMDKYRGQAALANTAYGKALQLAIQYADKPSPSVKGAPFRIEDAYHLLFGRQVAPVGQTKKEGWSGMQPNKGQPKVIEPKNRAEADRQVDEMFENRRNPFIN